MISKKSPASDLATKIFKLQREINELTERQDEMKKELFEMYKESPFDGVETLIGKVGVVVKGGATYEYDSPAAASAAQGIEDVLSSIDARKKELSAQSKALTDEAKAPKKQLAEIRKEFGTKVVSEDAEVTLRFTVNK